MYKNIKISVPKTGVSNQMLFLLLMFFGKIGLADFSIRGVEIK